MNNSFLGKYRFEILLLLFLVINFFLIFCTAGFPIGGDNFIGRIQILTGEAGPEVFTESLGQVFLRPLGQVIAYLFTPFIDAYSAMLLENLIFYLLTPFLFFYAAYYFFKEKRLAFYSSIFFSAAYPFIKFSLNYMADIGAWFFLVLSILLTLKYLSVYKINPKIANRILWLNPIVCFLGFLTKESGTIGIGFFILIILLATEFSWRERIKKVLVPVFSFLVLFIFYQIIFYSIFNFNSFIFFSETAEIYFDRSYIISSIIKKIIAVFSIGWLYVALGGYRIFKGQDRQKKIIILSLIPVSFSFLFWPYQSERLMAVATPLLSLLAVAGINIKKQGVKFRLLESLFIIIFIINSYLTEYFIINFDFLYFLN